MRLFTTVEATRVTGGRLRPALDIGITGVVSDSRQVRPGDLFVALPGARVDGHGFVDAAFQRGAVAALVRLEQALPDPPPGRVLIAVPDTLAALGGLAAYHRRRFSPVVVGVTGSVGKTSTKDLAHAVASQRFVTLKNQGNLNSDVGLPLSLFHLDATHQVAVLEMAMRGPGQIRYLGEIARPHIGVVTNIGTTHLELLGSVENIARAKGELLEVLPGDGTAVLNWDCRWVRWVAARAPGAVIRFALENEAEVRATEVTVLGEEGTAFTLVVPDGRAQVRLPVAGRHMVTNALAAAAVGVALGLNVDTIAAGLAGASVSGMRVQLVRRPGLLVINDAYNANPQSTVAALELLKELARRRAVAVLGTMRELGDYSEAGHREVGRAVARLGIDELITVGDEARLIGDEAVANGFPAPRVMACGNNAGAQAALAARLRAGDTVLVKGSRGLHMEEIVTYLEEHGPVDRGMGA